MIKVNCLFNLSIIRLISPHFATTLFAFGSEEQRVVTVTTSVSGKIEKPDIVGAGEAWTGLWIKRG
jgi:hypothetical protein